MNRLVKCIVVLLIAIGNITYAQSHFVSYEEAKREADISGKSLLLIFSGSDWCKPCIRLKDEVLLTSTFESFAKENLIVLEVDFPYRKSNALSKEQLVHNEALAEKFNSEGHFPKLVLINSLEIEYSLIKVSSAISPTELVHSIRTHFK